MGRTFSWNNLPVRMTVPGPSQLDAWAAHLAAVVAGQMADGTITIDGGDDDGEHLEMGDLDRYEFDRDDEHAGDGVDDTTARGGGGFTIDVDDDATVTVKVGWFEHAVWWLDPADCPGPAAGLADPMQCTCGPLTLLAVLEGVPEREREDVVAEHRTEMVRAFGHFWSGDGVLTDSDQLRDACPGCLIDGVEHVARVGAEAETLAVELGYALAAFDHHLTLGQARYEALGGD